MKLIKTTALTLTTLLMSGTSAAGHHEKAEGAMLAAQPGQMIIIYHWPCADAERGLSLLKEMIAYERDASPHPYSAAPGVHEDGALVSIDVHPSAESMEKATAWQDADTRWQALLTGMADACGSLDDLTSSVVIMK